MLPPANTNPPPVIAEELVVPMLPPTLNELRMLAGPYKVMADPLLLTLTLEAPYKEMEPEVPFKDITRGSDDWLKEAEAVTVEALKPKVTLLALENEMLPVLP